MRQEESLGASRFVQSALVVVGQKAIVCLLLVAMLSTAIYHIGLLVSVLSLPELVIALDVISKSSFKYYKENIIFLAFILFNLIG